MITSGRRLRAIYEFKPVDHLPRREFYIWGEAIERWKKEGLPEDYQKQNIFQFDPPAFAETGLALGWCEPPFVPEYEGKVIREEGDTEIVQDKAGRWLRCFKGRRHGFMPDYIKHPVSSLKDWEEDVAPRLDPAAPSRYEKLQASCAQAEEWRRKEDRIVVQRMVGGYMYLRALMGPEDLLYAFYDKPDLIHRMMERWAQVMDAGVGRAQAKVELDEISIGEDICYNAGSLISPDHIREFLFPYYRHVLDRARVRQQRKFYFTVDTDGRAPAVIDLYLELGMDQMWPFEVASGCDVVEIGRKYPGLIMSGGIDKRVLAEGKRAIDEHLEYILPAMVKRGGYVPTCDHGVPDNVSLENYLHYRKRLCELDH
ncbi:MAG: uroporphyrinogen decarboxylase family protein [Planctomycetota bacterium]